jgi:predicted lysophospholipase L1 biosynthesis ABC-type transport system permease subunit
MTLTARTRNAIQTIAGIAVVLLALSVFMWKPRTLPSIFVGYAMLGLLCLCVLVFDRIKRGQ